MLTNLNFWSAIFGLIGSVIIFFFGLPPKIDEDGHVNLILEQEDEVEKKRGKLYKNISYFGIFLITLSFLFQLIAIINNSSVV
jgi:hypothetical protein